MKLWIVRIERAAYVMAETKAEAIKQQSEIEKWEDYPTVSASIAGNQKLIGWDDNCLVYNDGSEDVKLSVARARCAQEKAE